MFTASRILYGLGVRGLAPRWVAYCNKNGVPVAALGVCVRGSLIALRLRDSNVHHISLASHGWLSWSSRADPQRFSRETFFLQVVANYCVFAYEILSNSWFIGISTLGTFIGWWTINLTFLRFCKPYDRSP